jgi:hypothetical protein
MYKASPRYEIPLTKERNKPATSEPRLERPQTYCRSGWARGPAGVSNPLTAIPATHMGSLSLIVQKTLGEELGSSGGVEDRKEVRKASHARKAIGQAWFAGPYGN